MSEPERPGRPVILRRDWHARTRALVITLRVLMRDARPASEKAIEYERLLVEATELLEAG